jgi:ketosteroid isomerase-like protein
MSEELISDRRDTLESSTGQPARSAGELVAETWRAWNDRELDYLAELFAEDVVYDATEVGDAVIHGRAKLRKYFDQVIELSDARFEVETVIDIDDRVVSVLGVKGQGDHSGAPILGRLAQVTTVRADVVTHARWYADPTEALAQIGVQRS